MGGSDRCAPPEGARAWERARASRRLPGARGSELQPERRRRGAGASHPPGPARSSRLQPGRLPGLRRGRAGPSPASWTAACAGRIAHQSRVGERWGCTWEAFLGGAAGAMRTEFEAKQAERGRPLHLLPGALRALFAFSAPYRPRGE